MSELTAAEAAAWLGISEEATHKAAREGRLPVVSGEGPRRFTVDALEVFHQARVAGHIAALERIRETPVSAAAKVRRALDEKGNGLPRSFTAKLNAMPIQRRVLFSQAELAAACVQDGCRWCEARKFADFKGLRPPEFSPALQELFGADPCTTCGPVLLAPYMAALAARVYAGDRRPPGPPPRPSEGERRMAEEWAVRRSASAARPGQVDDGRAMVAKRRREVQARLAAARRAGDPKYAQQLKGQLEALTADARRVDGGRS